MVTCAVHHVRRAGPGSFVVRFDRHGLAFEPGQHVGLGLAGSPARREYSIYSGIDDGFLEVLVREIPGGVVSGALSRCAPGDVLAVEGPSGLFITEALERHGARYLFIGSGTGIAPFHSLVRSYPDIDYLLLHGIRSLEDRQEDGTFDASRCVACVSGKEGGGYRGRVTHRLETHPVDPERLCYLCGNGTMIDEAFTILRAQGVPRRRILAEVYF